MSTEVVQRVADVTAVVAVRRTYQGIPTKEDAMSSIEAQQVIRERMKAISHTASVGGCLNYGSFVVKPAA